MGLIKWFSELIGWYPADMSQEERKLVFKIDWLVLSFSCMAYFTKNLDVSALTNAYVSGMGQDLDLDGNKFNYATSMYYVGYCLFQIPSNIVLTRLPAEYYLPAAEVAWGVFTLGTGFVKTYKQLMVLRFFVGLSATACYVGNAHIVNSWYTRQELGKRNAIYACVYPLGAMFSGYLQSAAYTNLDGKHSLPGWSWLFIICGIITIPCSIIGVIFCPNVPDRTKSRFLTAREKELCVERLLKDGFAKTRGVDRQLLKRLFGDWRIYVFFIIANLYWMTFYPSGTPYTLWLSKLDKYSIPMINNLSTITQAATVVSTLLFGFYSDWRKSRAEPIFISGILILVCNVMLLVWHIPDGAKFFAFIMLGVASGPTNLVIPWLAETYSHDLEARSTSIAVCNVGWVVINLVVPLVAWPTKSAPRYFGGYVWSVVWSVIELVILPLPFILEKRDKKRGVDYRLQVLIDNGIVHERDSLEAYDDIESAGGNPSEKELTEKAKDANIGVTVIN
ncbi:major facilitator superfamily domain-containing protein [Lipomyces japonicus]|uniref:major facilitator superfamily domain-containing protein n=1 Tax=Lipomyces japonicus TaxID=56871 RepID=UPI0034CD0960